MPFFQKSSSATLLKRFVAAALSFTIWVAPIAPHWAGAVDEPINPLPSSLLDPTAKKSPCEGAVGDPVSEELGKLQDADASAKACAAAGVCAVGESKITKRAKLFRFLRSMVVQTGIEIWDSVKAIRGKELRKRPTAMLDFVKNMAIIWPGQIFGWWRDQVKQGADPSFGSAPYPILGHTLFMVWTQSDRGAGTTPEADVKDPSKEAKTFWGKIGQAYRGKHGFWKENGKRLSGFLSIIPLEIMSLTILESLKAMPEELRMAPSPTVLARCWEIARSSRCFLEFTCRSSGHSFRKFLICVFCLNSEIGFLPDGCRSGARPKKSTE